MKIDIFALLMILMSIVSCKNEKKLKYETFTDSYFDLSKSASIEVSDTLLRFIDKNPIGVSLVDSNLFVICAQSDTTIIAYDIKRGIKVNGFGIVGSGPEDVIEPSFVLSVENEYCYLEDASTKKLLRIDKSKTGEFYLSKFAEYPAEIFPSSNLNMSAEYFVGRQVGSNETMFNIFNRKSKNMINVDFYPKLHGVEDVNYYCASNVILNAPKNRIVTGMYFIDMCQIYDLKGNLLKLVYFSEQFIPKTDQKRKILDLSQGYSGIQRVFPTKDACYLLRVTELPVFNSVGEYISSKKDFILIKLNWDGQVEKSFVIKDKIQGQFYIETSTNMMYAIRHSAESTDREYYDIVSYKIE